MVGQAFSDVIMKKYSLTNYVDEKILLDAQYAFYLGIYELGFLSKK